MTELTVVETESVTDITPDHSPIALAKEMLKESPDAIGGFYVLIDKDDTLTYDMAAITRKDLLWAIKKMENLLLNGDIND